jgi:hypothetical protein
MPAAERFAICDGAVEGFGSLVTAPPGFRLDGSGKLWRTGPHGDQPSGFRVTEEGEVVEDLELAENAGPDRHFDACAQRRRL